MYAKISLSNLLNLKIIQINNNNNIKNLYRKFMIDYLLLNTFYLGFRKNIDKGIYSYFKRNIIQIEMLYKICS